MIPREVWAECEAAVARTRDLNLPRDRRGALIVVAIWLALLAAGFLVLRRLW